MARPASRTSGDIHDRLFTAPPPIQRAQPQQATLAVDRMRSGLHTSTSRAEVPADAARRLLNARVRAHWTGRRPGTGPTIPKPDSDPVIGLVTYFRGDGRSYLVRVTPNSVHVARSDTKFKKIGDLNGVAHRLSFAVVLGRLYMGNGVDPIWEVDVVNQRLTSLEGSPRSRYLASYADRLIAGHNGYEDRGRLSSNIAGSGNGRPDLWATTDEGVDQGAFEEDLVQSPSDVTDAITGIFPLGQNLVVLRERSIWEGTRTGLVNAPVTFYPRTMGAGCDLPYTAVLASDFIIWADARTNGVWVLAPGSNPQRINQQIDHSRYSASEYLDFGQQVAPDWSHATWDPFENEYHLMLADAQSPITIEVELITGAEPPLLTGPLPAPG